MNSVLKKIATIITSVTMWRSPLDAPKRNKSKKEFDQAPKMDTLFDDEYAKAIQVGRENLEILVLASAWCENVDVTKGPLGTGLLEQWTGLPISGGSLRCDFAKAPTTFAMPLSNTAIEFYENNCLGCPHRKATNQSEHLGTWAEARIRDREEQEAKAALERREAEKACLERAAARRFDYGQLDPVSQSILDLLDRVDAPDRDVEAEQLIIKHAQMAPGDFSDALVEHLASEAMTIGNSAFLEAVIAIFERQGRPATEKMLETAFQAVDRKVAGEAAGLIIASHAQEFPATLSSLVGLVELAAGMPDDLRARRTGAEPAALLRLYDCHPNLAVRTISDMLADEDVWTRAQAAHAAEKVVGARPTAGGLLLSALLDSLGQMDNSKYLGDPFAAAQAARVVGDIFVANPKATDLELFKRIRGAEVGPARKLWECYETASPSRFREHESSAVLDTILQRALRLLESDLDTELLRDVAETVSHICRMQGERIALSLDDLVRLVFVWSSRQRAMEAKVPAEENLSAESFFAFESNRTNVSVIVARLKSALEGGAKRDIHEFVALIEGEYRSSESHSARILLLDVLQEVIADQESFALVVPLLRRALQSKDPNERASALRVIGQTNFTIESVPPDLTARVLESFGDDRLIVLVGAIRAAWQLEIPQTARPRLISLLLTFAMAYGEKRLYTSDVEKALQLVLRMAYGETYQEAVGQSVINTIASLPSEEAVKLLRGLNLEDYRGWPAAALCALREDSDPSYRGIGDTYREELLRKLASRSTDDIAPYLDDLVDVASQRLPNDPWWAWSFVDLLAIHQKHERAARLSDLVVTAIPDTHEKRPMRLFARQIALSHHANAATVRGDREGLECVLTEWFEINCDDTVDDTGSDSDR